MTRASFLTKKERRAAIACARNYPSGWGTYWFYGENDVGDVGESIACASAALDEDPTMARYG
jgi:hypothetical protein